MIFLRTTLLKNGLLPFCALLLLHSTNMSAAETPDAIKEYDIEIIVFKSLRPNDDGEVWPIDQSRWFNEQDLDIQPLPETDVEPLEKTLEDEDQDLWLPKETYRLVNEANALSRSAGYRMLAHFAWRQPVVDRKHAQARPIQEVVNQFGAVQLDGSVRVAVERYLHLYLDLQLHIETDTATDTANDKTPATEYDEVKIDFPELKLTEHRRMRSKELHYFDHPYFAVLALITLYEPPEEEQPSTDKPAPEPAVTTAH